jgi:hypothetical protein
LFLILLVTLNAIEEIVLGFFHGRAAREVLGEMAGGTLPEAISVCVLLLLVLIPYFSFRGLASRLGDGILWKHFTERGYDETRQRGCVPMLLTQLQRYAMHKTSAGGGRATSIASRRRF